MLFGTIKESKRVVAQRKDGGEKANRTNEITEKAWCLMHFMRLYRG
jgi:hypothetical protein